MTKKEYALYEKRFANFMENEGITNLSSGRITCSECDGDLHSSGTCDEECPHCGADIESMNEPFFSWHACECCGSRLGGDREIASGYNPTTKECYEYEICMDCVYYAAYGRLDDQTMMDLED